LVDATTGMRGAFREAKERSGLDPDADVLVVVYPKPKPLWLQLRTALETRVIRSLPGPVERLAGPLVEWLELAAGPGPALIAPFWVEIR
jgi:hypothetical protein